jgi:hypothetical protein
VNPRFPNKKLVEKQQKENILELLRKHSIAKSENLKGIIYNTLKLLSHAQISDPKQVNEIDFFMKYSRRHLMGLRIMGSIG